MVIAGLMTSLLGNAAMAAEEPTRVQIATASVRANGCSDSPQSFRVTIPHPERLNLNYYQPGLPAGIERGYAEKNGNTSDTNYAFADISALCFQQSMTYRMEQSSLISTRT